VVGIGEGGGWTRYLEGSEDGMCLADDSDDDGTLLDGFLRVLDLEDATLG
jgi:hypothetical protein